MMKNTECLLRVMQGEGPDHLSREEMHAAAAAAALCKHSHVSKSFSLPQRYILIKCNTFCRDDLYDSRKVKEAGQIHAAFTVLQPHRSKSVQVLESRIRSKVQETKQMDSSCYEPDF